MNKILFSLVLLLGLTAGASAQVFNPLKVALTNGVTNAIPLTNSRVDTSEIVTLKELGISAKDTTFVVVAWTTADSIRAQYKVQYYMNSTLIATTPLDSIVLLTAGTSYSTPARGISLWATKHPATTALRVIFTAASAGNQNGLASQTHTKRVTVGVLSPKSR